MKSPLLSAIVFLCVVCASLISVIKAGGLGSRWKPSLVWLGFLIVTSSSCLAQLQAVQVDTIVQDVERTISVIGTTALEPVDKVLDEKKSEQPGYTINVPDGAELVVLDQSGAKVETRETEAGQLLVGAGQYTVITGQSLSVEAIEIERSGPDVSGVSNRSRQVADGLNDPSGRAAILAALTATKVEGDDLAASLGKVRGAVESLRMTGSSRFIDWNSWRLAMQDEYNRVQIKTVDDYRAFVSAVIEGLSLVESNSRTLKNCPALSPQIE